MVFERFVSEARDEPPDIDVDFEHERREEVIQYLYKKYGRHRAALAATYICYRGRSAVRDAGKALGFSPDVVDRVAKAMVHGRTRELTPAIFTEAGLDPALPEVRRYGALSKQLLRFPRHLSIHVGGFILSDSPITTLVPVENASMEDRTVIQWDKEDIETLGLLKVDVLGLGMLSCIRKSLGLLQRHRGIEHTLASIPPEDPLVYNMICDADTVGVFQIESRAQMNMLPRLRPRCFYDLVVEVAIIRPGPIQGDMVHPYLRRRQGLERVTYPHPALRAILGRTYGVPLFQEQVMRLAVAVAGFTPGEADELRRAMGSWRRTGRMEELSQQLIDGMLANGLSRAFADQILKQIKGFAEYGFPESHAASFALLVYASAWLKCYHPEIFCCALLNSLPMGFYAPRTLVADAQRHGVHVRPVDVQHSAWDCTLEPFRDARGQEQLALRLGLCLVKGVGEEVGRAIEAARTEGGPFTHPGDLQARAGLQRRTLEALAMAHALRSLGGGGELPPHPPGSSGADLQEDLPRRQALWSVAALARDPSDLLQTARPDSGRPPLREPTPLETVAADYATVGLSLGPHPLELVRPELQKRGVHTAAELLELPSGRRVRVAGMVVCRQQPSTARGVVFLSMEDETGLTNVILWPSTFERYRRVAGGSPILIVHGKLEREGLVANLIAHHLEPLKLGELTAPRMRQSN